MNKQINKELEFTSAMPTMKKSLLALAVASTMAVSSIAMAADMTLTGAATWGTSANGMAATPVGGDAVAIAGNTLTFDGSETGVTSIGAISSSTDSGAVLINTADNAADVAFTIGSISLTGATGTLTQTLTEVGTPRDIAITVTGNTSITGNLAMTNLESDTTDATNTLRISGTSSVGGTSTVTGGIANGSTTTLTVTGNSTFTGALTIVGGSGGSDADATVNLNGATVTATAGIVLNDDSTDGDAHLVIQGDGIAQTITGAITVAADGEGTILVANSHASGAKFASNIGTTTVRALAINITDNDGASGTVLADFDGDVYSDTITLTAAGTDDAASATFAGNVGFTTLTLDKDSTEATVTFDGSSAQTVTGNIQGAIDTEGLVVVNNDVNFTGEIGTATNDGVGNVRVASGKTLTLTSGTAADGLYVTGKLDADTDDTRGGTVSLVASNASAEDTAGTTQISLIDGTTTLTAVNITGGTGGLSDNGAADGAVGGASSSTFTGASDVTTVTLGGGLGGAGMANDAADATGGAGGASTGTYTAALTATNVAVNAGTGGIGGSGGAAAVGNIGGIGGASTLDLNVATGTTQAIGTLTITGGTGGDGGATSTEIGGAGGAAGASLVTIAGDITGNIVLDDGVAGTTVASGGAGGAKGTATATFDGGTVQTITGIITASADGEGAIIFSGDSGTTADIITISGAVGTSAKKIGSITSGVTTAQTNSAFTSNVFANTITHGLDTNWTGDTTITMDFNGNATFTTLTVTGGSADAAEDAAVTAAGSLTGTTIALVEGSAGQTSLTLDGSSAQTISANITSSANDKGAITIANSHASGAKFTGNIGASATKLTTLTITDDDGASGTALADFDGNVYATTIAITAAGTDDAASATFAGTVGFTTLTLDKDTTEATVTFDGSSAQTVTGNIEGSIDTEGLVVVNNDVNFTGEIGTSTTDGVGNVRVASGKTLTLTSGTAADGLYVTGKLDADSADTRGGTATLVASNAAAEDTVGATQISLIDGTSTMTAVNITGGTGGLSDNGASNGAVGGASSSTFTGASDVTTVTLGGGLGGAGMANDAAGATGGAGGASTGTYTAALTATNVAVNAGTGGIGGSGGAAAVGNIGGIGGASTLDLNVATGTTQAIGTLTITGGTGGDGGATSTEIGGAGGAAGASLVTIAGDITGNIVLDDGVAGTTVASGGAGGAKGTATATFDGGTVQTITGTITASADGEGAIIFSGDSGTTADIITISGAVGTSAKKIGSITSGVTTAQTNSAFTSDVFATTITHGLNQNWAGDTAITMDFNGNATFTTLTVTGGSADAAEDAAVTAAGSLTGTTIALVEGSAGQTSLTLDGSSEQTVTAAITASAAGKGTLTVSNSAILTNNVGLSGNFELALVTIDSAKTLTIDSSTSKTLNATLIDVTGNLKVSNSTLLLSDAGTSTVTFAAASGLIVGSKASDYTSSTVIDATSGANVTFTNLANASDDIVVTPHASHTADAITLIKGGSSNALDAADFTATANSLATYAVTKSSNDILMTATAKSDATIASALSITSNQAAALKIAAGQLNGTASSMSAFNTAMTTGGSTATDAAEKITPDAGAAMGSALAAVSGVNNVISSRQTNTRVAFNTLGNTSGVSTGDAANDAVVWAQIFGSSAAQDKVGTVDGYDADSTGLALGWETDKSGDLMGLSVSYSDADVDGKSASASHTDTTAVQVSAYGTYGKATDWMVGYASGDNDTTRTTLDGTASGKYDSNIFSAKVGHAFASSNTGAWTMTPKVDASYTNIDNDGYTETGANAFNLVVASSSNDILIARAGAEFTQHIVEGDAVTIPHFNIMAGYDLTNDGGETSSTFTGGGSAFTTKGADPEKASLQLGFGVDHVSDDSTVSLDLNADLRSDYDSMSGSLTFKSKF